MDQQGGYQPYTYGRLYIVIYCVLDLFQPTIPRAWEIGYKVAPH